MGKFKVTPTRNGVDAPYIMITGSKESEAIKSAKLISGLSRFDSWIFNAKEVKK